jgi:hypothetical protein
MSLLIEDDPAEGTGPRRTARSGRDRPPQATGPHQEEPEDGYYLAADEDQGGGWRFRSDRR